MCVASDVLELFLPGLLHFRVLKCWRFLFAGCVRVRVRVFAELVQTPHEENFTSNGDARQRSKGEGCRGFEFLRSLYTRSGQFER